MLVGPVLEEGKNVLAYFYLPKNWAHMASAIRGPKNTWWHTGRRLPQTIVGPRF